MRILKGLAASLLWILAGVVGLVALLLCLTVILLPVGIPLLMLSRRMMGAAVRLMVPPEIAHPVATSKKSLRSRAKAARAATKDSASAGGKSARRARKQGSRLLDKTSERATSAAKKGRKSVRKRLS
jgi:hypothetical protein